MITISMSNPMWQVHMRDVSQMRAREVDTRRKLTLKRQKDLEANYEELRRTEDHLRTLAEVQRSRLNLQRQRDAWLQEEKAWKAQEREWCLDKFRIRQCIRKVIEMWRLNAYIGDTDDEWFLIEDKKNSELIDNYTDGSVVDYVIGHDDVQVPISLCRLVFSTEDPHVIADRELHDSRCVLIVGPTSVFEDSAPVWFYTRNPREFNLLSDQTLFRLSDTLTSSDSDSEDETECDGECEDGCDGECD